MIDEPKHLSVRSSASARCEGILAGMVEWIIPTWWAPSGFTAIPTAALDPPHRAAPPAVPAFLWIRVPGRGSAEIDRDHSDQVARAFTPARTTFCQVGDYCGSLRNPTARHPTFPCLLARRTATHVLEDNSPTEKSLAKSGGTKTSTQVARRNAKDLPS